MQSYLVDISNLCDLTNFQGYSSRIYIPKNDLALGFHFRHSARPHSYPLLRFTWNAHAQLSPLGPVLLGSHWCHRAREERGWVGCSGFIRFWPSTASPTGPLTTGPEGLVCWATSLFRSSFPPFSLLTVGAPFWESSDFWSNVHTLLFPNQERKH